MADRAVASCTTDYGAGIRRGMGRSRVEFSAAGNPDRARDFRAARDHFLDLRRHLLRRLRRDGLFDLRAPQVEGSRRRAVPREHDGRDHLDRHPVHHPDADGVAGDQDGAVDEGRIRRRSDRQDHRLAMEVELRLPERRLRLFQRARDAVRADREPRKEKRALPARSRPPAGRAGEQEDPAADHVERRHPCLVPAGGRRAAGRDSRIRARRLDEVRHDGDLSRPVREDLRQGARLHADRRRGQVRAGLRGLGRRAEEKARLRGR